MAASLAGATSDWLLAIVTTTSAQLKMACAKTGGSEYFCKMLSRWGEFYGEDFTDPRDTSLGRHRIEK